MSDAQCSIQHGLGGKRAVDRSLLGTDDMSARRRVFIESSTDAYSLDTIEEKRSSHTWALMHRIEILVEAACVREYRICNTSRAI